MKARRTLLMSGIVVVFVGTAKTLEGMPARCGRSDLPDGSDLSVSRPHPAQIRLLSFLALAPADRFVDLVEIDRARQVRAGDDLFVPSLVARGWAEMGPRHQASVRITDTGRETLIGPSADDHARRRDGAEGCGEI